MAAIFALWLVAGATAPAVGSGFAEGTSAFDVACTYAGQMIVNRMDADDSRHEPVQAVASYYYGRADAELSNDQVEGAANEVAAELGDKDLEPFFERCRVYLGSRSKAWEELSHRMAAKEGAKGQ